jgi:hypothetical protein
MSKNVDLIAVGILVLAFVLATKVHEAAEFAITHGGVRNAVRWRVYPPVPPQPPFLSHLAQ